MCFGRRRATSIASCARQTRRTSGAGAHQIRNGPQPEDGEGAWPDRAAFAARARRRGDRMMKRREFISLLGGVPPIGQGIDPLQLMMNSKGLPSEEFADYTFVF
jgi:hypothetical protein